MLAAPIHSGKVRRLYAWPGDRILMVATDAISAFDHVLPTPIPDKGAILTQLSLWWFDQLADLIPQPRRLHRRPRRSGRPRPGGGEARHGAGRVRRPRLPHRFGLGRVPAVAHGVRGRRCRTGWCDGDRLPEPIFTPAHQGADGGARRERRLRHRRRPPRRGARRRLCGRSPWRSTPARAALAAERGIILADTKFEFGLRPDGSLVLADEVLTPDSSRFWDADAWQPGRSHAQLRQAVRARLAGPRLRMGPGVAAAPALPDDVVAATRERYLEAFRRLTGARVRLSRGLGVRPSPAPPAPPGGCAPQGSPAARPHGGRCRADRRARGWATAGGGSG